MFLDTQVTSVKYKGQIMYRNNLSSSVCVPFCTVKRGEKMSNE